MQRTAWFSLLPIAAGLALVLLLNGSIPLGIPGEWTWNRVPPAAPTWLLLIVPCIAALCYLAYVRVGATRIGNCGRVELAGWLAGLVAGGFLWLWTVQEAAPPGFQLSKAAWVLYYKGSSGYFTQAREIRNLPKFLHDYERLMSEGDVLHIGTHPPGIVVCFRGLIGLCARSPALTQLVLATQPESVRESFDLIERALIASEWKQETRRSGPPERNARSNLNRTAGERLTSGDRAALWMATMLVQLLAASTVVPLFLLLCSFVSRRCGWLAASLWPATPAVALFIPKSDTIFPCLGLLCLYLWADGWKSGRRVRCLLAGSVLWIGLCLSLALLPVACLAAMLTLWEFRFAAPPPPPPSSTTPNRRLGSGLLWGAAGFLLPCAATWWLTGMNLFAVWAWNFRNHAAFYGKFPRTYWKWLLINPLELALAAGVPLAMLAAWSCVRHRHRVDSRIGGLCVCCAGTWGLLLISGKTMGEAARLWVFLMPWLILLAAPMLCPTEAASGVSRPDGSTERPTLWPWAVVLICQLGLTAGMVTHIVGFHVPQ